MVKKLNENTVVSLSLNSFKQRLQNRIKRNRIMFLKCLRLCHGQHAILHQINQIKCGFNTGCQTATLHNETG